MVDKAFLVAVQKRDVAVDVNQVVGAAGVDAIDHGGEGRGFTGTSGAGDEHEAALLFANSIDDGGKIELFGGTDLSWNYAQDHANVATLLENVDAEATEAGYAVSHVQFGGLLKFLL